jgi:hypothetical protein
VPGALAVLQLILLEPLVAMGGKRRLALAVAVDSEWRLVDAVEAEEMDPAGRVGVGLDLHERNSAVEVVVERHNHHMHTAVLRLEKAANYNLERPDMDRVLEDDFV